MKKLGAAISVYDKSNDVMTNVDIIRNHWEDNNDSFISVCCNDPGSISKIKELNVDSVVEGEDIQYLRKPDKRMRIFDCIEKSILACESEFIIHYHADAYALSSSSIFELIDKMEENNFHVAFRGRGTDYRTAKCIHGDVDDHFIIFRRSEIEKRDFFNIGNGRLGITRQQYFEVGNPESFLSYLIKSSFSEEEIYFYSNMEQNIVEIGEKEDSFYPDNVPHRNANPYNIDEKRKFLHIGDPTMTRDTLLQYGVPNEMIHTAQKIVIRKPESRENPSHVEEWINE